MPRTTRTGSRLSSATATFHPKQEVLAKVTRMKTENIRFVTRGLGHAAAHAFAEISSEQNAQVLVSGVTDLAEGIATMAASLKVRGRSNK